VFLEKWQSQGCQFLYEKGVRGDGTSHRANWLSGLAVLPDFNVGGFCYRHDDLCADNFVFMRDAAVG
jgi:hypothetical protein